MERPVHNFPRGCLSGDFSAAFGNGCSPQNQVFHTLYHTDTNVLLGAPTGSGKTNCAEMAMLRLFKVYPGQKVIYIAPLKERTVAKSIAGYPA